MTSLSWSSSSPKNTVGAPGGYLAARYRKKGWRAHDDAEDKHRAHCGGRYHPGGPAVDLMAALYSRRAVRAYTKQPVPPEKIRQLLHAAVQAPSALNAQPWAFAVFEGALRLRALADRARLELLESLPPASRRVAPLDRLEDAAFDMFYGAPSLIVILARPGDPYANEDCCLAAGNLLLAAHALGLASCPIGIARSWLDSREAKELLEIPHTYRVVFPVVVGYAAETPPARRRHDPQIVCWFRAEDATRVKRPVTPDPVYSRIEDAHRIS